MENNLTPEEIAKAEACQTMEAWNAFCDEVTAARGGQYPQDWLAEMHMTGRLARISQRWS